MSWFDYLGGIDLERVWDAIENYLPRLETAVQELRKSGQFEV